MPFQNRVTENIPHRESQCGELSVLRVKTAVPLVALKYCKDRDLRTRAMASENGMFRKMAVERQHISNSADYPLLTNPQTPTRALNKQLP